MDDHHDDEAAFVNEEVNRIIKEVKEDRKPQTLTGHALKLYCQLWIRHPGATRCHGCHFNRILHRRKRLPAQQAKPVDNHCDGAMPEQSQQTGETFQIHRNLCNYAEEWSRATILQHVFL